MVDDSDRVYRPSGNGAAKWPGAEQPWPPDESEAGSADQDPAEAAPVHGGPPVPPPPPPIRVPAPPAPPPINRPGLAAPLPRPAGSPMAPPVPPPTGHGAVQPAPHPTSHGAAPSAPHPPGPIYRPQPPATPHPVEYPSAGPNPPPPQPPEQPVRAPQGAAVPVQRNGDGQVAGTPWAQPPQRLPIVSPAVAPPHHHGAAAPHHASPPQTDPAPQDHPHHGNSAQERSHHAGAPQSQPAPPQHADAAPEDAGAPPAPHDGDEFPRHLTPVPPHVADLVDEAPTAPGEIAPGVVEVPQQGVYRMPMPSAPPATATPRAEWAPDGGVPTADDFARRRALRAPDPIATSGVRAVVNRTSMGLVKLPPGSHERERRQGIETIRRNFGGLRQVTVVNPKGGAGKTVAILLLAMTFGQKRGGYVLAWDNNETQGTLGMRAQQDFHNRTVRDLLRDLAQFRGAQGRVGDLSQYVRAQGEGMFDVLASDESATAGEMLTAAAFAHIRDVVSRFYKLIFVDTGNNVRAQNWQAAIDATDQLVVTMSARNDSAETAARMLDHLEQTGRHRLVRQAVTVVSMPPSRREIDLPPIESHFAARTRAVLLAPYERLIDTGEPLRYAGLSRETRDAWLRIAAAVAEGL
ncbi:chromosome partitioning protein [Asanoa sp. NPDC049518]|uniref:chromosome partitioning protein n=1 Tax=unclassified Asanoa TaxID=2685164 RepID=UPI00344036E2